jgi:hypothetical protein
MMDHAGEEVDFSHPTNLEELPGNDGRTYRRDEEFNRIPIVG